MTGLRSDLIPQRLGAENADRLAQLVGGSSINVPETMRCARSLKARLGDHLATLVVLHFGDSRLYVPKRFGPDDVRSHRIDGVEVVRLTAEKWTAAQIARHLRCSERTVHSWRAKHRARPP